MQAGIEHFGALDILVVGSGLNDVSPIVDMSPERFENVMHGNVTGAWLLCRAFGQARDRTGPWRQGRARFLCARQARASGRLQRLLRIQGRDRRTDAGAGLRVGQVRHHGQCHCPDGVSLPAHRMDVRGQRKGTYHPCGHARAHPARSPRRTRRSGRAAAVSCSPASDFYTGHILYADGGYTAG